MILFAAFFLFFLLALTDDFRLGRFSPSTATTGATSSFTIPTVADHGIRI
jgi:hypothetical protein